MPIYLIRHGETALNAARIIQPADTPLSERGRAQAAAVAKRMQTVGLVGILSSDLPRARQTAQAIADATGLAVIEDASLRERNFGALRGKPIGELGIDPAAILDAPPDGESQAEFRDRAARAFAVMTEHRRRIGGPLAVISHGLVIRAVVEHIAPREPDTTVPKHLTNTAVTILEAEAPHTVSLAYCEAHLRGLDAGEARGQGSV